MSAAKWDEFWWWVIAALNVSAAIIRAVQGQVYETVMHATVVLAVWQIIGYEREIRRLRASKTIVLYSTAPVFRDEGRSS